MGLRERQLKGRRESCKQAEAALSEHPSPSARRRCTYECRTRNPDPGETGKTYARFIVYGRWSTAPGEPKDIYRPHATFHLPIEAIEYLDSAVAENAGGPGPTCQYKLIDLEHLDLGDMMRASECRAMVEATRKRIAAAKTWREHHARSDAASDEHQH